MRITRQAEPQVLTGGYAATAAAAAAAAASGASAPAAAAVGPLSRHFASTLLPSAQQIRQLVWPQAAGSTTAAAKPVGKAAARGPMYLNRLRQQQLAGNRASDGGHASAPGPSAGGNGQAGPSGAAHVHQASASQHAAEAGLRSELLVPFSCALPSVYESLLRHMASGRPLEWEAAAAGQGGPGFPELLAMCGVEWKRAWADVPLLITARRHLEGVFEASFDRCGDRARQLLRTPCACVVVRER